MNGKFNSGKKLAVAIMAGILNAPPIRAQSGASGSKTQLGPAFEVATVKPVDRDSGLAGSKSKDGGGGGGGVPFDLDHRRLRYVGSLYGLILRSDRIQGCVASPGMTCPLLSGGPAWINKDIFEIQAKAPAGSQDYTVGANGLRDYRRSFSLCFRRC
jgi:hypothetical protein